MSLMLPNSSDKIQSILTIGIVVLGQSPRPDLIDAYQSRFPNVKFICKGGLDGIEIKMISTLSAKGGRYPLMVILADGSVHRIAMPVLFPYLKETIHHFPAQCTDALLLMCSADFPDFGQNANLFIRPHDLLRHEVKKRVRGKLIGVISPIKEQGNAIVSIWKKRNYQVSWTFASPLDKREMVKAAEYFRDFNLELLILDCMGFTPKMAQMINTISGVPCICPQELLINALGDKFCKYNR